MKNFIKYFAIFCCSILLGIVVISLFPPESEATGIQGCGTKANPACLPWLVCTNHSGCDPGHYAIMYGGMNANCATCILWEACVESCPPA